MAELAAVGVPVDPRARGRGAAEDHQTANARALAAAGGGRARARAPSSTPTGWRASSTACAPIPARLAAMAGAPPGAAGATPPQRPLADLVEELAAASGATARCPPSPLDLAPARPLPRRRRRRPGHERHRPRPGRDGPRRVAAATSASCRCSTGCGPPASTVARRPRPRPRRRRRRRHRARPRSRRATSSSSTRRRAGHPGAAPGRHAGRRSARCAAHRRRRRHARQDDDVVDAGADAGRGRAATRASSSAATSTRSAPGAQWTGGRVARRRGRRERRHVPRAAARRHRSSPTSSPTTSTTTARSSASSPAFDRFLAAGRRARRCVCADDPVAARLGRRHGAVTYGTADGADYRIVDVGADRRRRRVRRRRATASALGDGRACRCPACTTPATPPAPSRWRIELGVPVRGRRARRSARFGGVARRFEFRGERRRRHASSTTTPTCRARSPPCSTRRATSGDGWQRVVAVFQPHRYSRMAVLSPRLRATRSSTPTSLVLTDIYPAGEAPRPGRHRQARRRTPCSTPTPSSGSCGCPRRADLVAFLAGELRAGDVCITLGGGDSPTLPDEVLARLAEHGGRRRERDRPTPLEAAAGILGALAARDVPLGPLTTYRVGGPAALFVHASSRRDDLARRRRARCAETGVPRARASGGARTCSSPTPASPAWSSCSARVRRRHRPSTATVGRAPARRCRCRCWPGAPRPPGSPGFEWAVGVPGSVGGAVRMNAGGHGSDMAAVAGRGSASSTCARGEDGVVAADRARPALTARSALGRPPGRRLRPSCGLRAGRPRRRRGRDRRDRALAARATSPAARTPARCSPTRPATRPARLIDAAGLQGPARRHGRRCRRSTPTSSRPTRAARPTTCSR